jgi:hypothetical protein
MRGLSILCARTRCAGKVQMWLDTARTQRTVRQRTDAVECTSLRTRIGMPAMYKRTGGESV